VALNLIPHDVFGMFFPIFFNLFQSDCFISDFAFSSLGSFGFPGARELAEMFAWFNDYGYFGKADPFAGRVIDPSLRNFKEYLVHADYHL
jgi:hypothetical protein